MLIVSWQGVLQRDACKCIESMEKDMMNRRVLIPCVSVAGLCVSQAAMAEFTVSLDSADFGVTSVYNNVASFSFDLVIDAPLVAGGTYSNPAITSVEYKVFGVLDDPLPTPSGFPQFQLVRSMTGAEFYSLSPESGLSFAIDAGADLSDGVQLSELAGAGAVFELNLREFNQAPGRYHPPILTLNSDGTGRLVNADNQSTFKNPDPPVGSGLLVDVDIADEYDVTLSFDPSATTIAVPEPTSAAAFVAAGLLLVRRRRSR